MKDEIAIYFIKDDENEKFKKSLERVFSLISDDCEMTLSLLSKNILIEKKENEESKEKEQNKDLCIETAFSGIHQSNHLKVKNPSNDLNNTQLNPNSDQNLTSSISNYPMGPKYDFDDRQRIKNLRLNKFNLIVKNGKNKSQIIQKNFKTQRNSFHFPLNEKKLNLQSSESPKIEKCKYKGNDILKDELFSKKEKLLGNLNYLISNLLIKNKTVDQINQILTECKTSKSEDSSFMKKLGVLGKMVDKINHCSLDNQKLITAMNNRNKNVNII